LFQDQREHLNWNAQGVLLQALNEKMTSMVEARLQIVREVPWGVAFWLLALRLQRGTHWQIRPLAPLSREVCHCSPVAALAGRADQCPRAENRGAGERHEDTGQSLALCSSGVFFGS
jgi:hypothetical protein